MPLQVSSTCADTYVLRPTYLMPYLVTFSVSSVYFYVTCVPDSSFSFVDFHSVPALLLILYEFNRNFRNSFAS